MKTTAFLTLLSLALAMPVANAERLTERGAADILDEDDTPAAAISLPAGVTLERDIAYGGDPLQRMDVYRPVQARNAPMIVMVHGGGWRRGDKAMRTVVENKLAHWAGKGFVFISVNYRLLPQADPAMQAGDVARALATAQQRSADWGGDPAAVLLMGHSAGAHLVALLSADPSRAFRLGAKPWIGTVALDSAALDVAQIMQRKHFRLYDSAFGDDPSYWETVSPFHALSANAVPVLAVCSTRRTDSCAQANRFIAAEQRRGIPATELEEDLTHRQINDQLGLPGPYTSAVDSFIQSLGIPVHASADSNATAQTNTPTPLRRRFLHRR